jgi:hypothetical protein
LLLLLLPRLSWLSNRTPLEENPAQSASTPSLNRLRYLSQALRVSLRGSFLPLSFPMQPFPNRASNTGEDNRRKEQPAIRCPLQQAGPGAADSSNRKGENNE